MISRKEQICKPSGNGTLPSGYDNPGKKLCDKDDNLVQANILMSLPC